MSNELQERQSDPVTHFREQLTKHESELLPVLGAPEAVKRFVRVVLNAVNANEDLLMADRRTLFSACNRAAADGLLPDGREAVLNIYNTKVKKNGQETWVKQVQYLPMVQGLIKLMYEAPSVVKVDAAAVYEKDEFKFSRGLNLKLEHEPYLGDDDPGKVKAAYCVVWLKDSPEPKVEVINRHDIEKMRAASKSSGGPAWTTWYDQMSIKSVIKRIAKQLPRCDKLQQAIDHDNSETGFDQFSSSAKPEAPAFVVKSKAEAQAPALEHAPSEVLEPVSIRPPETIEVIDAEPVRQPQRQQAAVVEPVPASSALAAKGEKAFIEKKAKALGVTVNSLLSDCELTDWENLSKDGFIALKGRISELEAA